MTIASLLGILVFVIGVPAVTAILFVSPKSKRLALGLLAFTTCYVKKPFYQEVFFVDYRGVDRGFGVTMSDLLFFGMFFFMLLRGPWKRLVWLPYNTIPWLAVIAVGTISTIQSEQPLYGAFTLYKFVRCALLYWVVVNAVRDEGDIRAMVGGLVAAVYLEFYIVMKDKYITMAVVNRSLGSFRHPNTLAMYCDLVSPVMVGVLLANRMGKRFNRLLAAGIGMAFVCVIFTKCRVALILHPLALGGVAMLSLVQRPTTRKVCLVMGGLLVATIVILVALPRIIMRFEHAPEESAETRVYFNAAARAMASDRFFGIGLNQYSYALAGKQYYWYVYPDMLDVSDPDVFRESLRGQSRLGTVHNIYLLYASEIGWLGMGLFVLHTLRFLIRNVWLLAKDKDVMRQAVYQGILCGTLVHHVHGNLEWIFRQTEVLFLVFILMGLMVAQWGIWQRERREVSAPRAKVLAAGRT